MRPKRIILVRHGESFGNIDKSQYAHTPDFKIGLTDLGSQQAIEAGNKISEIIDDESIYTYCSPWKRARETYDGINAAIERNVTRYIEDPRLREQDWGHFKETEFLEKENKARKDYGKFYFRLEDGESCADVYDRMSTFLETLHRDFRKTDYPKNALIVTHGVTLLVFCMRWFHWTVEEFELVKNPKNGQVVILEWDQENNKYDFTTQLLKTQTDT